MTSKVMSFGHDSTAKGMLDYAYLNCSHVWVADDMSLVREGDLVECPECAKTTFTIQLGDFKCQYRAYETTAPQDYDGFGTISIHNVPDGHLRWVLIRTEHETWQVLRYRSGMYSAKRMDNDQLQETAPWITDHLHRRITQQQ